MLGEALETKKPRLFRPGLPGQLCHLAAETTLEVHTCQHLGNVMEEPKPTFYDRFLNTSRYDRGVWHVSATVFQVLEWMLVAGALQFIAIKFDSTATLVVATLAWCLLSLHVAVLVGHTLSSLFPALHRLHWSLSYGSGIVVVVLVYALILRVFNDIVASGA